MIKNVIYQKITSTTFHTKNFTAKLHTMKI